MSGLISDCTGVDEGVNNLRFITHLQLVIVVIGVIVQMDFNSQDVQYKL